MINFAQPSRPDFASSQPPTHNSPPVTLSQILLARFSCRRAMGVQCTRPNDAGTSEAETSNLNRNGYVRSTASLLCGTLGHCGSLLWLLALNGANRVGPCPRSQADRPCKQLHLHEIAPASDFACMQEGHVRAGKPPRINWSIWGGGMGGRPPDRGRVRPRHTGMCEVG